MEKELQHTTSFLKLEWLISSLLSRVRASNEITEKALSTSIYTLIETYLALDPNHVVISMNVQTTMERDHVSTDVKTNMEHTGASVLLGTKWASTVIHV